jgi:hypothetical protein
MKHEPLRLRDIIAVDPTDGWLPDDEIGLIPYQYYKRHRSYVEDEEIGADDIVEPDAREIAMARSAAREILRLEILDGSPKDDLPLARRIEIESIIAGRQKEVNTIAQTILTQTAINNLS